MSIPGFLRRPNHLLQVFVLVPAFLFTLLSPLEAVRRRPSFEEDNAILLREILDCLDNIKNDVQIHESRLATFEEKFKNIEDIIDSVRQQVNSSTQAVRETLKNHSADLNAKLADQQNNAKGLFSEVKSFANDNQQTLNDYRQRIAELEKNMVQQNSNISNLQSALASIIDIIKNTESAPEKAEVLSSEPGEKIYKVKAGDSLEKIAKQNQTSVKKLKELNNLTSDQIIIGQKLKIRE